jgi:hypothetical protein
MAEGPRLSPPSSSTIADGEAPPRVSPARYSSDGCAGATGSRMCSTSQAERWRATVSGLGHALGWPRERC